MIRKIILENNIYNELWSKLVLAITYIKNNQPTKIIANNFSLYKAHFYKKPDFSQLQILDSTIYILLYKKEDLIKSKSELYEH